MNGVQWPAGQRRLAASSGAAGVLMQGSDMSTSERDRGANIAHSDKKKGRPKRAALKF
jgi:hypothetical protein